jgi:nicotinic acid mononucleotide adenylyltransferase
MLIDWQVKRQEYFNTAGTLSAIQKVVAVKYQLYIVIPADTVRNTVRITDTVYLENRFSTVISYVVDSTMHTELIQKQQELEERIRVRDREFYHWRDSTSVRSDIIEVNRLTKVQRFLQSCGFVLIALVLVFAIIAVYKLVKYFRK